MRLLHNSYIRQIASLTGQENVGRALEVFVGARRAPGDSLEVLAHNLGIGRIIEQRLPFEGGLFKLLSGELVIKLNADSSFVRKRFTLAHEIGHLLLNTAPAFRSTRRTDAALERTCDLLAAELLMPTEETTNFVRELGRPTPEKLNQLASKYAVSTHVAAIRLHDDLKLWKHSIGMWERSPKVRTLWFVGRRRCDAVEPDPYCLDLALASKSSIQTEDLWRRGEFTGPVRLDLLGVGNSRVLGLVDFVN